MLHEHDLKAGPPRLDPVQRLMHRFCEPLVLLSILNPQTDSFPASLGSVQRANDFLVRWKEFIDTLAWFGDFEHGGRTVTAVAAEDRSEGPCYWVASQFEKSQKRIEEILEQLRSVSDMEANMREKLTLDIAEVSIDFASQKVKKYKRELMHYVKVAPRSNQDAPFLSMIHSLETMIQLSKLDLCQASMAFTHSRYLNRLARSTTTSRQPSPWSPVRHFVYRLQSWHNRAELLVEFAGDYPQFFEHITCQWLRLPESTGLPPADHKTNLPSMLGRMLQTQNKYEVSELCRDIRSLQGIDIEQKFMKYYTDKKVRLLVHAETYLLEYFYFNDLKFVEQYKYIGASKPSCYCCNLYMKYHPGNFMTRASHGMAWSTWCPPLFYGLQDPVMLQHSKKLLGDVIGWIRRDLLAQIRERIPRQKRQPDSTSGRFSMASREWSA